MPDLWLVDLFCPIKKKFHTPPYILKSSSCVGWLEWWPMFLPNESIMCWVARMVANVPTWRVHHVLGGQCSYLKSPSCVGWPGWWPIFLPEESILCWVARMVANVPTWRVYHVLGGQNGGQCSYLKRPSGVGWPGWWPVFLWPEQWQLFGSTTSARQR